MKVSRHARQRFYLRVRATVRDPVPILCAMWHRGEAANEEYLRHFRVTREVDAEYRVAKFDSAVFLMVVRNGIMVKVLEY